MPVLISCSIRLIPVVLVSALLTSSSLAQTYVPDWGVGTLLRGNDAPDVYVVVSNNSGNVTAAHIGPANLNNCYGGAKNIVIVLTDALRQPSVLLREGDPCIADQSHRSFGDYQEAYEDGSNGARHIGASAWTNADRTRTVGVIRYESDTVGKGVCGGMIVGLLNSSGQLIQYYTPPTGCGNGKLGGHAEQRKVPWSDSIPANVKPQVAGVKVRVVWTQANDKFTWDSVTSAASTAAQKFAAAAKLLGLGQ
jgi:hypothetical protein